MNMWFLFDVLTAFTNMGLIVSGCSILVLFVITVLLTHSYPWLWTVLEWGYGIFAIVVVIFLLVAFFTKDKDEHYGVFGFIKRFVMWFGFALMFAGGFLAIEAFKSIAFSWAFPQHQAQVSKASKTRVTDNTGSSVGEITTKKTHSSVTGFKFIIETKQMDYSINGDNNAKTDLLLPVIMDNDKTYILTGEKDHAFITQDEDQVQSLLGNQKGFRDAYNDSAFKSTSLYNKKDDELTMHLKQVPYVVHYTANDPSATVGITKQGSDKLRQVIDNPFSKNNSNDVIDNGVDRQVVLQGNDLTNTKGKNYKINYTLKFKLKQIQPYDNN